MKIEEQLVAEKKQTGNGVFEPKIVAFMCNWCSYSGADLAGVSRIKSSPNIRIIRTMCSGRVDPSFILRAFELGADGVLIAGCHFGDCHYVEGNFKTMDRITKNLPEAVWNRRAAAAAGMDIRIGGGEICPGFLRICQSDQGIRAVRITDQLRAGK